MSSESLNISEVFKEAVGHHQAGRLVEARRIYERILAADPENAYANHLLGVIFLQEGNADKAVELIGIAIEKEPSKPSFANNLGNALQELGRYEEAIESYKKALTLKSDYAEANNNQGNAFKELGRFDEAIACYREALAIRPDYVEAYNNLGVVLKNQGRFDEAAEAYRRALAIDPGFAEVHSNQGDILVTLGKPKAAEEACRQALAIDPSNVEAHNNLGNALKAQGRLDEALMSYRHAIGAAPYYPEAHNNLGNILKEQGKLDSAIASYQMALAIKPDYPDAYNNLANTLEKAGRMSEAVENYRKALAIKDDFVEASNNLGNILMGMGQMEEALTYYNQSLLYDVDDSVSYSNLLYAMNYSLAYSRADIYHASRQWAERLAEPLLPVPLVHANSKDPGRRLKVGYVSPDFREHSVSYFFEPLLKAHDRKNFEIYLYSNTTKPDPVTERLKKEADHWVSIVGRDEETVADMVRNDTIDILVDLTGHTAGNSLLVFARKPAPIQVSWLGYPNTTGLAAMDYRFTDAVADPVGEANEFHTEKLVRLEHGFLCYQPQDSAPEVSPLPCRELGYVTFGSFNNLTKVTPEVVKAWSAILQEVPAAKLLMKCKPFVDGETRKRYLQLFADEGIAGERLELVRMLPSKEDHLNLYSKIDIGLDPFPYNGTTTTCEAMWMGVPVVTMPGDRHAGRVGASIMHQTGLQDRLVAHNRDAYVRLAADLAGNMAELGKLRAELRSIMRSSHLQDSRGFAKNIENAYKKMWDNFVRG